jgi:hypothetical protein
VILSLGTARTTRPSRHPAGRLGACRTSQSSPAIARPGLVAPLRSWRTAVGLTAAADGATIAAGAFLPWVSAFAGLVLPALAFWPLGRSRSAAARRPLAVPHGQVVAAAQPM